MRKRRLTWAALLSLPVGMAAQAASETGPARCSPEVVLFGNNNPGGVSGAPRQPTRFTLPEPGFVTSVMTYHWNGGRGQPAGNIGLRDDGGRVYGPWNADGSAGQGGVPNAYWVVRPGVVLQPGTYTVLDSHGPSWAQNDQSRGEGIAEVRGCLETRGPTPTGTAPGVGRPTSPGAGVDDVGAPETDRPRAPAAPQATAAPPATGTGYVLVRAGRDDAGSYDYEDQCTKFTREADFPTMIHDIVGKKDCTGAPGAGAYARWTFTVSAPPALLVAGSTIRTSLSATVDHDRAHAETAVGTASVGVFVGHVPGVLQTAGELPVPGGRRGDSTWSRRLTTTAEWRVPHGSAGYRIAVEFVTTAPQTRQRYRFEYEWRE
jgi:hypothetical protein